ncbi:MAG: helix-turn-helix domain-containing protein [Lachnospiraceae bacterium]|nr:helix-turn-helix domain-containing protein [Lachnospiraceae bacterium]MBD5512709.1 helix-turn-helix domain-containing protein [Lachnospiraceae bacterium]
MPMNESYQNVLQRLKEERKRKKWSQEQISRQLRMSQSHYSKVELGKRRFTYYEVQYLYGLDVDAHYIFTGQKSGTEQEVFFSNCDYRELNFYMHILAYVAEYLYVVRRLSNWETVYKELKYIGYITAPDRINDNSLFALRRAVECSQQKMAEKLGVDIKKIRSMENGESLPDSEILWNLYQFFRIPPAVFIKSERGMVCAIGCILSMLGEENREHAMTVVESFRNVIS